MAFLMMGTTAWADIVAVTSLSGNVWRTPGNCTQLAGCTTLGFVGDAGNLTGGVLEGTVGIGTATGVNFLATGADTLKTFVNFGGAVYTSNLLNLPLDGAGLNGAGGEQNVSMSGCPGVDTNLFPCYSTDIQFTGTANFINGQTYTLTHDDGAIMTIGSTTFVNSPHPTSSAASTFIYTGTSGSASFAISYMATNGNPEKLELETTPLATPDGGMTLMLLGGALVGLETLRRKFRV
jgi:hypothetical protein